MQMNKDGFKMDGNAKMALLVVALAIFTDIFVYAMIVPILPQYATDLGASQQLIGIMFASYAIAFLIASPVMGIVSDRIGRRKPMIYGLAGLFLSTLLFAFANDAALLIIARTLQGISAAATWTAGLALLADVFPASARQQVIGIALTGSFVGMLVSPAIGGYLYEIGGYMLPFLVAAAIVAIDGIARIFLLKDPAMHDKAEKNTLKNLLTNRTILVMSGIIVLASGAISMLEPTLPLFLQERMGVSPGAIGILFGIMTLASVISAPIAYKLSDALGRKRVILLGLACTALAMPLLAIPASFIVEAAVMALLGAILSIMLSSVPQEMTDVADRQGSGSYGSIYALYNVALSLGMVVGPIAGGMLAGYFGLGIGLIIAGAGMLAYVPILLAGMRKDAGYASSTKPALGQ